MNPERSIAVIGSGIAGLAASWHLGENNRVTLFERQPTLGMAARGLELGGARVDMPLRVLYRGYYPNLTALYRDAGIATVSADYSASFSELGGRTYFRYRNWRPAERLSVPLLAGGQPFGRSARRIVLDLAQLYARAGRDARRLRGQPVSLEAYVRERGFSREFIEDFLLPAFAAIGTCDFDSVRRYPARVVIDYLRRGVLLEGVSRTERGADHVVEVLSARCADIRTGTAIAGIERQGECLRISGTEGVLGDFDHVVMATQGNQARELVADLDPPASEPLGRFRYEPSEVVVHTDAGLMPPKRGNWSPVNFFLDRRRPRPMATIWLNAVLPMAAGAANAFQTWNPLREPAADTVLARASFERPVVDAHSEQALKDLHQLHADPARRLWYCGSYAQSGVPLLESAARSAREVAARIALLG